MPLLRLWLNLICRVITNYRSYLLCIKAAFRQTQREKLTHFLYRSLFLSFLPYLTLQFNHCWFRTTHYPFLLFTSLSVQLYNHIQIHTCVNINMHACTNAHICTSHESRIDTNRWRSEISRYRVTGDSYLGAKASWNGGMLPADSLGIPCNRANRARIRRPDEMTENSAFRPKNAPLTARWRLQMGISSVWPVTHRLYTDAADVMTHE